jgi:hypothetical protein
MPTRPLRRPATLAAAAVAMLVAGLLPATAQAAPPAARTTADHRDATVTSLRVAPTPVVVQVGSRTVDGTLVAGLADRRTPHFSMVGVTWDRASGRDVLVEVRTRGARGWSNWTRLDVDPDNDASGTRAGTEPLWVHDATGVATRVRSADGSPQGVKVVLVDPGTDPAGTTSSAGRTAASSTDGSPTYTPMPPMITRSQWGARADTGCDSPRYGSRTRGVIFHHTAGSNSYARSDSKAIVRSTQAYHMQGRGWCDIGYDFLVDKYGQIFEGRSGGVLLQVRGAHAGNYTVNTYDMGVSMMGNLDKVRPTAAMKSATVQLVGWRLGTNFLPAKGTYTIAGHRLNRIAGHRDVYNSGIRPGTATACPGRYGYAWMKATGGLRDRVAAYIRDYASANKSETARLGRAQTGDLNVGEYPTEGGRKARFSYGDMYAKTPYGAHFVRGSVRTEYTAWDSEHGALGFPTTDIVDVVAGKQAFQRYEHGSIYRVPQSDGVNEAFGLTQGVDDKYRELGEFDSDLGAPTSRVSTADGVDTATFEHGRIDYDRAAGVATVTYD